LIDIELSLLDDFILAQAKSDSLKTLPYPSKIKESTESKVRMGKIVRLVTKKGNQNEEKGIEWIVKRMQEDTIYFQLEHIVEPLIALENVFRENAANIFQQFLDHNVILMILESIDCEKITRNI